MDIYSLNVDSPIKGGYFSSEQIDLLSIIQCQSIDELMKFIANCDQINHVHGIFESINGMDLESAKRSIFKSYQDSMVYHDQGLDSSIINRFNYLGITSEELMSVIDKSHPRSQEILSINHHFISEEWNQTKSISYEEMETLNSQLPIFNSMLIGSGKIYKVINKYDTNKETKYDFYFAKRDLDFAYKNGKQVRFHSLLVKEDGKIFNEKSKEEIMDIIKEYVKQSIDFINGYNSTHKININGKEEPVINAVDLFNEIVSFDKNEQGEYYNIWEQKYGILMSELMSCFEYALINKPEGVNYLYNEPFLENDERRKKVFETLAQTTPGLIDTLGSQMHITITQDIDSIKRCFADFKRLQDNGMQIQITEFDMCLGRSDVSRVFGPNANISLEIVYQEKDKKISEISSVIRESGVRLSGISYWSLTDGIDCNLERIRSNALANHEISNVNEIPTVCGGLLPTHKKLVKNKELNQMLSDSNQSNKEDLYDWYKVCNKK
jgi:hypothetical protein